MERPLSPHLQVYRPEWTSMLSILHRMTGAALSVGVFPYAYWIWALSDSEESFLTAQTYFSSWWGQLFLMGWSFCLFYHLCNGIRHLAWDMGYGFELPVARASGYFVLVSSFILTACVWGFVWWGG